MRKVFVGDFQIGEEEKEAVNRVLNSGRISEGIEVRSFEKKWADYVGTKYSVLVNSGTSALIAGISAARILNNIKEKSKVITTPITYIATSNAVIVNNLEPVYVDIDKTTFGITSENIKAHLESVDDASEYSIILPVHLMGYPCDMDKINKIAKDYGLTVLEDSAQAHGSMYNGKKTGSMSLMSFYSFYIAHNIQAGELGAVNTSNLEVYKLIKKIKANGRVCDCPVCTRSKGVCPHDKDETDPRFTHDLIGYNFKTMEFQAALASTQLKKVDWIVKKRQENVKYLNEGLEMFSDKLQLPLYSEEVSYLAYPLVLKDTSMSISKFRKELEKNGVENRPLFGCIPTQQPAYSHLWEQYKDKIPNADYVGKYGFYIGCHQYLELDDLDYVIKVFGEVLK